MAGTRTNEQRLAEAHRLAAQAIGHMSLSLTVRRLSRAEMQMCLRLLGEARAEIERILG